VRRYGSKIALLDENGPVTESLDQPTHQIKRDRDIQSGEKISARIALVRSLARR